MKLMVERNKILELEIGSHLYGTNTPESDKDYSGIFVADPKYYFGLQKIEEVDMSIVSKDENGKNDKDAIDIKFYEVRKFVKLALDNNPNIIEQLFTPKPIFTNSFGNLLLSNAHLFPHKGCAAKFLGYAKSQLHKMRIKPENYTNLKDFYAWLDYNVISEETSLFTPTQLLAEMRYVPGLKNIVKFQAHHAQVGDLNISLTHKLSKVVSIVYERLSKVTNREELYTKYGYDTKFGMHLIRLMFEGIDLLNYGKLIFPLPTWQRDSLMDIRNGKWSMDSVITYAEELEIHLKDLENESKLPNEPRTEEIDDLLIKIVKLNHMLHER